MEGLESLLFYVVLFWVVLHVLQILVLRRGVRSGSSLPAPTVSGLRTRSETISTASLRVTLRKAFLRVEFAGLNRAHDELPSALARGNWTKQRRYLTLFYDVGVALCCVGTFSAIALLCWVTFQLLSAHLSATQATSTTSHHVKRGFDPTSIGEMQSASSTTSVQLLVSQFTSIWLNAI